MKCNIIFDGRLQAIFGQFWWFVEDSWRRGGKAKKSPILWRIVYIGEQFTQNRTLFSYSRALMRSVGTTNEFILKFNRKFSSLEEKTIRVISEKSKSRQTFHSSVTRTIRTISQALIVVLKISTLFHDVILIIFVPFSLDQHQI